MTAPHLDNAGLGEAILASYSDGAGSTASAACAGPTSSSPSVSQAIPSRGAGAISSLPSVSQADTSRRAGPTSPSPSAPQATSS
eukprot:2612026-Alexandrium_andersonii.AAC.1